MSRPVFRSAIVAAALAATSLSIVLTAAPASAATAAVSRSHYIRNLLATDTSGNATKMETIGKNDAQAAIHSVETVLHLGAQSITAPLSRLHRGILLSATTQRLTYRQLVIAIEGYLNGFVANRVLGAPFLTVAVATNNDGDNYGSYTATQKADDFANGLIDPLRSFITANNMSSKVGVLGAIDIEAGFASTFTQAHTWETEYLAQTHASLHYTGSADACPFVGTNTSCGAVHDSAGHTKTWTQANYVSLTLNGTRIKVLPQIYVDGQASQWSHIDLTSGKKLIFAGSLTQNAACGDGCSFTPSVGWGKLATALSNVEGKTPGTVATDLDINGVVN